MPKNAADNDKTSVIQFRCLPSVRDFCKNQATLDGCNMSDWVNQLILREKRAIDRGGPYFSDLVDTTAALLLSESGENIRHITPDIHARLKDLVQKILTCHRTDIR